MGSGGFVHGCLLTHSLSGTAGGIPSATEMGQGAKPSSAGWGRGLPDQPEGSWNPPHREQGRQTPGNGREWEPHSRACGVPHTEAEGPTKLPFTQQVVTSSESHAGQAATCPPCTRRPGYSPQGSSRLLRGLGSKHARGLWLEARAGRTLHTLAQHACCLDWGWQPPLQAIGSCPLEPPFQPALGIRQASWKDQPSPTDSLYDLVIACGQGQRTLQTAQPGSTQ